MDNRYKIVISSRTLYKEIELSPSSKQLKVGTGMDCDVRLHKSLFFGQIELLFTKTNGDWTLLCSDNLYITVGDIRKMVTKNLHNGDSLEIKYYDSDNTVFHIDFLIDFDDGHIRYERIIDTSYQPEIRIGCSSDNTIVISSAYVQNDGIVLNRKGENYVLNIIHSSYGVLHNGKRAESGELVKNGDFIFVSDFFFCLKDGRIWTQIRDGMVVHGVRYTDRPARNEYPKFIRNTRIKTAINTEKIEILDPPAKPEKPKNNLMTRLLPAMGMLAVSFYMMSRGGSMVIMSVVSGGIAIVTAVMGVIEGKKEFKEKTANRIESYNNYIERKREEIQNFRHEELTCLDQQYLPQSEVISNFDSFSPSLFDRRKTDDDFLCVRLGTGAIKSLREINYKKQEKLEVEDDLQKMPTEVCRDYMYIENAPIVCPFREANLVGIVGQEPFRFDFLKNMVVDIAARQYSSDVKMIFVAAPEHKERVYWFRFLPQVMCDAIGARTMVVNDESKNIVFEYLYKELTTRNQTKHCDSHIVAFMYDEYGFQNHPISKFVDEAASLGVTFVFFADTAAQIPMGCSHLVEIEDAQNARLLDTADQSKAAEFEYPRISDQEVQDIIDIMAPVYTEEISLEGSLTKNISLFELLNIIAVDDLDIGRRWASTTISKSMAAPLGIAKSGVVYLDLHDKAHGPHGLVAGTTGSGKSEILQTYILAMATLYHPYEVGFLIIDFKGGGMVNQFRDLPHLVGAITNIDGKEINRSLKSIKAELQKRQRFFADADVNHIDKYIGKFKKGDVSAPLPHLIIIVDEFAELKAEQPEFMKELISAARIGRSLGVHLILATQKPSGQVNEQIWSNSRFKLCLKVQSPEDSNEMLKSPLAAEIKEPGRAYLQVGNNEIFELFQSAYSGAPERTDGANVKEFTIFSVDESGKRMPVFVQKKRKASADSATQLEAIVGYVNRYCSSNQITKLPDICLPSLEQRIEIPATQIPKADFCILPLGIYDDPDNQYQGEATLNVADNNTLIIGSAQMGKTNMLQTLIREIAQTYSPEEVAIYIADFGAMSLCNFEKLNHVGGVVTATESEKFKNLLKLMMEEIELRKQRLSETGLSSFRAYRESGETDMPLIIFIMDNYSVFKELYAEEHEATILNLVREGITYGITMVLTNTLTAGISFKMMSSIGNRIAFTCNDRGEYASLFNHCWMEPSNMPGRALVSMDKTIYECQTYLCFDGEKEFDRVNKIRAFVKETNNQYPGLTVKQIPSIPEIVSISYICQNYPTINRKENICVALDYGTIECITINCYEQFILAIAGKNAEEKRKFLKLFMRDLKMNIFDRPVKLYIQDNFKREFSQYKEWPFVESYSASTDNITEMMEEIEELLSDRYSEMEEEGPDVLEKAPWVIVVLNNKQSLDALATSRKHDSMFGDIAKKYSALKVLFLLTDVNDSSISSMGPQPLRKVKEDKKILYFGAAKEMKLIDVYGSTIRTVGNLTSKDDAYWLNGESILRVKTIQEV